MSLSIFVPVITALAGVVVGGLVAEMRNLLEAKRERRKALNRVLASQLDLWNDLKKYDVGRFLPDLLSELASRTGIPIASLAIPPEHLETFGEIVVNNLLGDRDAGIDERYETAVDALAPLEPVLSYRLGRKTHLVQFRKSADAYVSDIYRHFGAAMAEPSQPLADEVNPAIRKGLLVQSVGIIEGDILAVAEQLGAKRAREVRKLIKKSDADARERIREQADETATQFLAMMTEISVAMSKRPVWPESPPQAD